MSEFNPMEKMGSEHLASRPLGSSPATAPASRSHHYAAEAPRVLARMPDLGMAEAEREAQLPSLEHDGRLLSSRVSVAILMGGVATLLLVALGSYVFFGNDKATDETATWQPPVPAPNAAEAPAWGGAMPTTAPSPYTTGTGTPSSVPSATAPNAAWNPQAPSTSWNPELASRPTMPWRNEGQAQAANTWGSPSASDPAPRAEQQPQTPPQTNSWNTTTPVPATSEPSYGWNSQSPSVPMTSQESTASWNTQSQTPSWSTPAPSYGTSSPSYGTSNPSYGTASQTPNTSWNTATQASAVESQPLSTTPAEASRPAGPMMPNAPTSFNASYEASRSQAPYGNPYQPQSDTNRATVTNGQNPANGYGSYGQSDPGAYRTDATGPQPAATQPYNYGAGSYGTGTQYNAQPSYPQSAPSSYRNDRGADAQPASTTSYGYNAGANYNQASSNNYQPSYQPGYQANPSNTYPAAGATSYPTTDSVPGATAPASYVGGAPYAAPGAARFQGTIEKPSVRTTYDRTGSSLY